MFLTLLKMILNIPVFLVSKLVRRDENLSIIGSSLGKHFADNSKYFYIYFHTIKKNKKNKLIWITKNKEVYNSLKSNDMPVEYLYSIKGLLTTIRASKVFLSHQLNDIYGPLFGNAQIIQLWHGYPLKKIGYEGDWYSNGFFGKIKYFIYKTTPFNYYMSCDKLIAPSAQAKENLKKAFSLSFNNEEDYKNILNLGYPRNDALQSDYIFQSFLFPEIEKLNGYKQRFKHVVSWLPTQRKALDKTIIDLLKEPKLELENLNEFCKKNGILFVFKPHFLDIEVLSKNIEKYDNLVVYDIADPYPLLSYTDILLTDYSSVYFDFLLTKKPIIFTPFDYKEYKQTVNFYQDYYEVTPGVKCYEWDEVMKNISTIIDGKDDYMSQREEFFKDHDYKKNSSKLIYDKFFTK